MAELTPATSFVFSPKGPYSLAASIGYLEGFAPAAYDSESAANLEVAFCADGYWDPVAVRVHKGSGAVHGTVHWGDTLAPAVIAAAIEQVERILSLDIDGRAFPDIARHDSVVAQLLRPVCIRSPYEAAAWSVIGQRIRIVQAAAIKARITADTVRPSTVGVEWSAPWTPAAAAPPPLGPAVEKSPRSRKSGFGSSGSLGHRELEEVTRKQSI